MKNLILALFSILMFLGCSSIKEAWNADENIKKVEIGMTKNQVINIMGKSYDAVGARKTYRGRNTEIIGYTISQTDRYIFHFEDGKLVEWYKEAIYSDRRDSNRIASKQ